MIIAIDGPAASGKGTLAKRLAAHFGLPHLDTGLLYRAVGRAMLDRGLDLDDADAAADIAERLDVGDLDEAGCAAREMGEAASVVAAHPEGPQGAARPAAPLRRTSAAAPCSTAATSAR